MTWLRNFWDRMPWRRLAILERRISGLSVCPSCGCVIVPGHPGVRSVTAPSGEVITLCKWDHSRLALKAKGAMKS